MESSNKTVFPLPVGAKLGKGHRVCCRDTFHRGGWTYRSLPSADVVSTGQADTERRELTKFSPEFMIYDRHKRDIHL
jgi:hypothetical protein